MLMKNTPVSRAFVGCIALAGTTLAATAVTSCVSTSSGLGEGASEGCPEFTTDGTIDANVKVDVKVHAFMQASADLHGLANQLKGDVKNACTKIASDLGGNDTWSALGDGDDAISNDKGTGACDVAKARMVAIMESDVGKRANFALVVTRGECHADFQAEADCEAGCSAQTKCDPGKVEERCQPGGLSVQCQDKCTAQSYCEGTAEVEASCSGKCEAQCDGACQGTCTDQNGKTTENDPNCHGKCSTTCNGKCTGRCQVEASDGISCGANVRCQGSCTSTFTDPVCETTFTPPKCQIDESCFASCRASTTSKAKCDPPSVKLACDTQGSSDLQKLVATVNANLPALISAGEAQGKNVVQVGTDLVASGSAVLKASGDLDAKSLSCATAAAKSANDSANSVTVSANAGAGVTQSCSSHAQ